MTCGPLQAETQVIPVSVRGGRCVLRGEDRNSHSRTSVCCYDIEDC